MELNRPRSSLNTTKLSAPHRGTCTGPNLKGYILLVVAALVSLFVLKKSSSPLETAIEKANIPEAAEPEANTEKPHIGPRKIRLLVTRRQQLATTSFRNVTPPAKLAIVMSLIDASLHKMLCWPIWLHILDVRERNLRTISKSSSSAILLCNPAGYPYRWLILPLCSGWGWGGGGRKCAAWRHRNFSIELR